MIENYLCQQEIEWEFNPPTASHIGGVWERQICTVQWILNALLKQQELNDECLSTLMCQVEGIVNSRPLTPVSNDPKDAEPLTPNHLLLLRSGTVLPPGVFVKEDMYQKGWRQVQYLADVFWRRWVKEYLPTLQQRQKWLKPQRNMCVGDIVLIVDEKTPRSLWPLGRVVKTTQGRDGLVRSVEIKTRSSMLTRPIHKVCLLEGVN